MFHIYNDYVILIEPATPALIPYYTKYKKPNFPYTGKNRIETYNYLVYGNLTRLKEICFEKIFNSMRIIKKLKENLKFKSLEDLYNMTSDLVSLKEKLHHQLVFLIRTKQLNRTSYEELNKLIDEINYYDIDDIIITSRGFDSRSMAIGATSSGGKKSKGLKQMKKRKHKTQKRKKIKRKNSVK